MILYGVVRPEYGYVKSFMGILYTRKMIVNDKFCTLQPNQNGPPGSSMHGPFSHGNALSGEAVPRGDPPELLYICLNPSHSMEVDGDFALNGGSGRGVGKTEIGRRKTGDRSWKKEVGRPKWEDGRRRLEDGRRKTEVGRREEEVGRRKTEAGRKRKEDGSGMKEEGS